MIILINTNYLHLYTFYLQINMIYPIVLGSEGSLWPIAPFILFAITFIVICFYILKYAAARTLVGYSALVGVLAALINSTVIMALIFKDMGQTFLTVLIVGTQYFLFQVIYIVSTFVPGLIAFRRISRHRSNAFGKYTVYFGFLWSATIIIVGLVLTITFAIEKAFIGDAFVHMLRLWGFLNYCSWGFVAIFLVLHGIYFEDLKGKSRSSFLAYTSLNIFSILALVVLLNIRYNGTDFIGWFATLYILNLFLCDVPVVIAFIIAVHFGHLWDVNSRDNVELDSVVGSQEDSRKLNDV